MKLKSASLAAALAIVGLSASTPAFATVYTENIVANPASFGCFADHGLEACDSFTLFDGSFFTVAGDQVTLNLSYTSPVTVPASHFESDAYLFLFSAPSPFVSYTDAVPGDRVFVTDALIGYSGPGAYSLTNYPYPYAQSNAGYYAPFALGNPGSFSFTGMDTTFDFAKGDPETLNILAIYGYAYAVPEPLTLSLFGAGLVGAAALRRRRKKGSANTKR